MVYRDDIGNLKDLLVLINEECGNPKVVDGGELTRNINQKKRSKAFYEPADVHSVTNAIGESISSISF